MSDCCTYLSGPAAGAVFEQRASEDALNVCKGVDAHSAHVPEDTQRIVMTVKFL